MKLILAVAAISVYAAVTTGYVMQDAGRAPVLAREVERLANRQRLWPGFDPMAVPLAIYDGDRTYLFRHPKPPDEFAAQPGSEPAAFVYQGRHRAMTANSSAEIGGVLTATLMADRAPSGVSPTELAAVAIHEAFHVYQRKQHPRWTANEGDLFVYPINDARLLTLRRLETEALRRALAAPDRTGAICWARQALAFRHERFEGMSPAFGNYERQTELNEGLAAYVQLRVAGQTTVMVPAEEFAAAAVRQRAYAIGPALALILDRVRPDWPSVMEADEQLSLDGMLASVVGSERSDSCSFTASETANIERIARENVAMLAAEQAERRKAFDGRPGWSIVVQSAEGQPLWPQGFDPLNIGRVEGGLLHTRFLRLGNDAGQLEAIDSQSIDIDALTEGIGPHPLFNGVRRTVIAGLVAKPEIKLDGRHAVVQATGFAADFENVDVRESGTQVLIELRRAK